MKLPLRPAEGKQNFERKYCLNQVKKQEYSKRHHSNKELQLVDQAYCKTYAVSNAAINLPLLDRVGLVRPLTIEGNICIISSNTRYISDLVIQIQLCSTGSDRLVKMVTLAQFCNILPNKRNNPNILYVINLDHSSVNAVALSTITAFCCSIFVFPVKGLRLICSLNVHVNDNAYSNNIIASLGGDFLLRRHLIASLESREFLIISGDTECVRSLGKNMINFLEREAL